VLRVGVIGCGRIATTGHHPAFAWAAQAGACTLVGVCDIDPERAETVARKYGVPSFDSAGALLARVRPDVVSVATLPSSHRELVVQALDAGCHVLCALGQTQFVGLANFIELLTDDTTFWRAVGNTAIWGVVAPAVDVGLRLLRPRSAPTSGCRDRGAERAPGAPVPSPPFVPGAPVAVVVVLGAARRRNVARTVVVPGPA
jgi:hypothetical protein